MTDRFLLSLSYSLVGLGATFGFNSISETVVEVLRFSSQVALARKLQTSQHVHHNFAQVLTIPVPAGLPSVAAPYFMP